MKFIIIIDNVYQKPNRYVYRNRKMNRFDQSKHDKEDDNNARGNCTKQSKILGKFII